MCIELLAIIYRTRTMRGSGRVPLLEEIFSLDPNISPVEDDFHNERINFTRLFQAECRQFVPNLYEDLMRRISVKAYCEASSELGLLAYVQELVGVALWKYDIEVSEILVDFAKTFDRLDVELERQRLHDLAVQQYRLSALSMANENS